MTTVSVLGAWSLYVQRSSI